MLEKIDRCYICAEFFDATVLKPVKVPSQGGDVDKPICDQCLQDIEVRSHRRERAATYGMKPGSWELGVRTNERRGPF